MSGHFWEVNDEAIKQQIFSEFGKTEEDLRETIGTLEKWAESQHHFPEKPNEKLLRFLILLNKFSIERAKQKLDMYYTIRSLMPEFFNASPLAPDTVLQSKVMYCVVLPKPTPDCKRVVYCQINPEYEPKFYNHELEVAIFFNLLELLMQRDKCYNFHFVFDCAGARAAHLAKFSPMVLKKSSVVLEKVYSNRVSSFHIVNFPPFLEALFNTVVKPAFGPKIRERIHVHSGTNVLLDIFGKSIMPKDIGGDARSLAELNDFMLKLYESDKDRFDALRSLRVNESLRPQPLMNDEILGYYGNFRKICVD